MNDQISPQEWQTRVDLAAAYRLVDYYGMADVVGTHISARVPGEPKHFLLNPHGLFFEEITASSLLKVNMKGEVVSDSNHTINQAGFTIHSAILEGRKDLNSALHTHSVAGMAVSCMAEGLMTLTQHALRFHGRVSYHDYEGVANDLDERERLARDLGPENLTLILRNHGLLTTGRSVAESFNLMFYLEKSCMAQIEVMTMKAAGGTVIELDEDLCEDQADYMWGRSQTHGERAWPGHLRRLDRLCPDYKH